MTNAVRSFLLLAGLFAYGAMCADAAEAQVGYDSPRGRVEVIGLHRWTLRMLRDSVSRRVPGQKLEDAACMVTLRDSLHFADASVVYMQVQDSVTAPVRNFLLIKVVEPSAARRVRMASAPPDSLTVLRPAYAPVILPVTDSAGGLWVDDSSGRCSSIIATRRSGRRP